MTYDLSKSGTHQTKTWRHVFMSLKWIPSSVQQLWKHPSFSISSSPSVTSLVSKAKPSGNRCLNNACKLTHLQTHIHLWTFQAITHTHSINRTRLLAHWKSSHYWYTWRIFSQISIFISKWITGWMLRLGEKSSTPSDRHARLRFDNDNQTYYFQL